VDIELTFIREEQASNCCGESDRAAGAGTTQDQSSPAVADCAGSRVPGIATKTRVRTLLMKDQMRDVKVVLGKASRHKREHAPQVWPGLPLLLILGSVALLVVIWRLRNGL
jgi:hypothetical protein